MEKNKQLAQFILGNPGRMVGASKSIYRYDNPTHVVVFNGNLVDEQGNKLWYGDLDLTLDIPALINLAEQVGSLYVVHEMDGRFENENTPNTTDPALHVRRLSDGIHLRWDERYYEMKNKQLVRKPDPERVLPSAEDLASEQVKADVENLEGDFEVLGEIDIKALGKLSRKADPLEVFWGQVKQLYPDIKSVSDVKVTKEMDLYLEVKLLQWVQKYEKDLHPVKQTQTVAMAMLNMGPSHFYPVTPTWAKGPNFKVYRYIGEE